MEPIGTITSYFQFLDEETIAIVKSLTESAINYMSFIDDLVEVVCHDDPSPALRYFALIQSLTVFNYENLSKMRNIFDDDIAIEVLSFWSERSGFTADGKSDFIRSIEEAISTQLEPWIAIVILLYAGSASILFPDFTIYLDKARVMIESNEKLQFFKGYLHLLQGNVLHQEGNLEGAEQEFEDGFANSKEFNNLYLKARLLFRHGNNLKNRNTHVALEKLEEGYRLSLELGDGEFAKVILNSMGLVYTILGEYDLALEAQLGCLEGDDSEPSLTLSFVLARTFCDLNRGKDALEWIQWGESSLGDDWPSISWHLAKAQSLTQLNRTDEATSILDSIREKVLKSGSDVVMADYYFVQGNYHMAINDIDLAFEYLEKSLEIYETIGIEIFINRCLLALTRAEIAQAARTKVGADPESSGRWMSKLKTHAEKKNYPGIRMQHALLKAEYQSIMDDYESSRETLVAALKIYESLSVKSLRKKIQDRITEIDSSITTI
ncbi:MAG: hypothetical protein ACFFF9_10840 [Candidatus Thorarchaeota archaeon]